MASLATDTSGDTLSTAKIVSFALPVTASGYMFCLVSLYSLKFATDVLLIAPAIMGLLFGVSRLWDAVSDPLVGYLSDKTKSSLGRRRPWILWGALPVAITFWMMFAPPLWLSHTGLIVWMGIAVVAFHTAQTLLVIPHMSLGAELTQEVNTRNKIFGARHAGWVAGYIIALGTLFLLIRAEGVGEAAVRALATEQTFYAGAIAVVCFLVCVAMLRENPKYMGRGGEHPWRCARDVLRNRPGRLMLTVHFMQEIAMASIVILTVYVAEYVVEAPILAPLFILSYLVFSFAFVPMWVWLARRVGKKRLWLGALLMSAFAFGSMFFIGPGDNVLLMVLAAWAGFAGGALNTIGPAILGDVIDFDEYTTGERKEGTYAAAWYFVQKLSYSVMLVVTGFAMSATGFVPKAAQSEQVITMFLLLYAVFPFVCFFIGAAAFLRYDLSEKRHEEIVRHLKAKTA